MTRHIFMIDREDSVADAMKEMFDNRITSLIVRKNGPNGYGIITRKDILSEVIAKERDPRGLRVEDIMSEPLKTVSQDEDIEDVAALMAKLDIRRFPVIEGDNVVGLISNSDILKAETMKRMEEYQE